MNRSDSIATIAPALVKALSKIEGVAKTKANPGFKGTKYADLEAVIDASKDILTEHGLTILQFPSACVAGVMSLETILLHESGEYISETMGIALGKTDPQGVGSAITYARRYAQMAALNMPAVDDDGEAAMGRGSNQSARPNPQEPTGPSSASIAFTMAIGMCNTPAQLKEWWDANKPALDKLSDEEYRDIGQVFTARKVELKPKAVA